MSESATAEVGDRARRLGGPLGDLSPSGLANRFGLILAWVIVIAVFSALRPDTFFSTANFEIIFGSQVVLLVLTLGLLVSLLAGEFDLSVAGVMSVSVVLIGWLNVVHHWPVGYAVVAALASGIAFGLVNAFFVIVVGVESIVVTLGTGTLLTGAGFGINGLTTGGCRAISLPQSHRPALRPPVRVLLRPRSDDPRLVRLPPTPRSGATSSSSGRAGRSRGSRGCASTCCGRARSSARAS